MFMGEDGTPITISAGYDGLTKAFFANVATLQRHESWLRRKSACTQCVVHRSSESDIAKVTKNRASSTSNTKQARTCQPKSCYEERPVRDSNANGSIERANQTIQGQIRVIKDYTERQIGAPIGLDSSVLKWRVRDAAWTLTTFNVGSDGMTARQRIRGKPFNQQIAAVGEQILFTPHKTAGAETRCELDGRLAWFQHENGRTHREQ